MKSQVLGVGVKEIMDNSIKDKTKVKSVQLGRLLKSSIFVVQKAAAPKNGVEFRQRSIGALRSSLATSYDDG